MKRYRIDTGGVFGAGDAEDVAAGWRLAQEVISMVREVLNGNGVGRAGCYVTFLALGGLAEPIARLVASPTPQVSAMDPEQARAAEELVSQAVACALGADLDEEAN